jgi:hypothetical protein
VIAVDEIDRGDSVLPPEEPAELVAPAAPAAPGADHSAAIDEDSLSDDDLSSEIELVADLVVAASSSDEPLSPPEIDRILGVDPA